MTYQNKVDKKITLSTIAILAWNISKNRNSSVFDKMQLNVINSVNWCVRMLREVELPSNTHLLGEERSFISNGWFPPNDGFIKVNFDGFYLSNDVVAVGVIG